MPDALGDRKSNAQVTAYTALAPADDGWRPIESAPKEWFNGDLMLARLWRFNNPDTEYAYSLARFAEYSWLEEETGEIIYNPIALMPLLPAPPKDGRK